MKNMHQQDLSSCHALAWEGTSVARSSCDRWVTTRSACWASMSAGRELVTATAKVPAARAALSPFTARGAEGGQGAGVAQLHPPGVHTVVGQAWPGSACCAIHPNLAAEDSQHVPQQASPACISPASSMTSARAGSVQPSRLSASWYTSGAGLPWGRQERGRRSGVCVGFLLSEGNRGPGHRDMA